MQVFLLYSEYKKLFNISAYKEIIARKEELQLCFDQLKSQLLQQGIAKYLSTTLPETADQLAKMNINMQTMPELLMEMENTISTMHEIALFQLKKQKNNEKLTRLPSLSRSNNKKSLLISYLQQMRETAQAVHSSQERADNKRRNLINKIKASKQGTLRTRTLVRTQS